MSAINDAQTNIASGDSLDVRRFSVRQGISELFTIELTVVSPQLAIDFDQVIGLPADFSLGTGSALDAIVQSRSVQAWSGICREMEQIRVDEMGLATYRLEIVPRAWLMTQRTNFRIFQYQSELEIVRQLLGEWGVEHEVRVDPGAHLGRKFRVQYEESDFAFMSRLLEDAGISYTFEQSDAGTKLVLDDAPETREMAEPLLSFYDEPGSSQSRFVTKLAVGSRLRPGAMRVGDVDFRRASRKQPAQETTFGLEQEQPLEQFDFEPGAFLYTTSAGGNTPAADDRGTARTDDAAGARKTMNRLLGHRNDANVVAFVSDVLALVPGTILSIVNHPHAAVSGSLLVTRATIEADYNAEWRAQVESVPASQPYKPALVTPKPRVRGLETATIVGPGGEEIYTDEYARVRVHFHWDRESAHDERSSCWLPTNQPWAGNAFGAINLPRIGQEVLVEFLAGDPDRPVVIGRVYTEPNPPPDPLPKYKNVSGLFSEATPRMVMGAADGTAAGANLSPLGGTPMTAQQINDTVTQPGPFQAVSPTGTNHQWTGSGLKIDDTSMAENLYIQANRDLHMVAWNDWKTVIGNSRATKIGTDDFTKIEGSQGVRIDNEQRTTVKNDCKVKVHGKRTDKVGKRMTQESQGDIVAESSYGNLVIGAKGVIRVESDEKIQLQSTDTGWQGTKSLVTIGPNDITFLAGTNKVEINPRGSQTPSESVGGIWLTPEEQAARDQARAEQEAAAAAGRDERLARGAEVMQGLSQYEQPTGRGEDFFARQRLQDAGITQRAEQDMIIDNYMRRNSLDMQ